MEVIMNICSVEGCNKKSRSRGLCNTHYTKLLRAGPITSLYDHKGYDELDGIKDTRPGHRGSLSVNIVNDIKYKAIKRGKVWNLAHTEAFQLIRGQCYYCGFIPSWPDTRVGIDRVNNDIGYENTNCVSCCFTCNSAKGILTTEEFYSWIKRVYEHSIDEKSLLINDT